jgi:hypothetical protein
MKPFNFFLIAIGFVIAFPIAMVFTVFGFLWQSIRIGFEVGQGLFGKMEKSVEKFMSVK